MTTWRRAAAGTAALVMLLLAGCSGVGSSSSRTVVLYSPSANELGPVIEAFEEAHPDIRIEPVRVFGGDLISRMQAEATSGNRSADVVISAVTATIYSKRYHQFFAPYSPIRGEVLPTANAGPAGLWTTPFSAVAGVVYNTNRVPAAEAPTSWNALLDPKWRGRIALADPSVPESSSLAMIPAITSGTIDEQWIERLAAQKPRIAAETPQVAQSLTTGETDVAIYSLAFATNARSKGAPIEFVAQTSVMTPMGAALVKDGPNPEAAKLFLDFLVSAEGQATIPGTGYYPLTPGAPLPAGFSPGDPAPKNPPASPDESLVLLTRITDAWKRLLNR